MLDKQKKGDTHKGYHWVYYSPQERLVLFDYQPGRGKDGPAKLLKSYKGYLQTDGYAAYDQFEAREDIVLVSCMAHARRYFEHALENDKARAEKVLLWMQALYAVEREAREKNLSAPDRYLLRQQKARPVMDLLGEWVVAEHAKVLPKSAIGKVELQQFTGGFFRQPFYSVVKKSDTVPDFYCLMQNVFFSCYTTLLYIRIWQASLALLYHILHGRLAQFSSF